MCHDAFMAQRIQTTLIDDLDGSEATQTVTFALRGIAYEIDLSDDHATALEESLEDWIAAARKTTTRTATLARLTNRTGSAPKRDDLDSIRAWARENGHTVAERGRIKQSVIDAYDNR